ncbi:hypothetical protein JTB14_023516 [Gonioctena quinquepunctata]|nr:hypothetical protein JTB14_023516 [Gonioctena quinquepunctata]
MKLALFGNITKTTLASKGNLVPLDIRSVKNVLQCLTVPTPLEIINCHFFDRKIKKSKSIKNVKKLPLFYKSQPKAWMTAALFTEWYDEVFIPEVKKHQKSVGKEGSKVLLIVDNAPTHPTAELLERENGQFKTTFLPPNVTSLLQPMDQSVIETMKRHYRRQLLNC